MSTSKHIGIICLTGGIVALLLTLLFVNAEALGIQNANRIMGYEAQLFDTSKVHTIEIVMDDWDGFLESCESKEYAVCSLVIDGQSFKNVAIRAKGNNSLTSVSSYGNDRYSFKVEFDHYDSSKSYYGLDKLNLNSLIHDNTMMKDYLTYQLMSGFGVAAPLSSYTYITVNGEEWGLYLAVEGIEEAFLERNYGSDYGALYKPDSTSSGGQPGRANSSDVKLQYIDDAPDSYSNIFENAKTEISEADKKRLISSLKQLNMSSDLENILDIEAVIRYFVVHNYVCNFDSYTGSMIHNYYLYEKDGRLSMIPWDYNLAFGSFQDNISATALVNFPIDTPVSDDDVSSRPMLAWILNDEMYMQQYHQLFNQFISQYFEQNSFEQLVDHTLALISSYVEQDPTKFCTYEEFETGVAALKDFCLLRAESISGQLDGSIPSTKNGQNADSSALIDASNLNMSDIGSMNGGAPNGGGEPSHTPNQGNNEHDRQESKHQSEDAQRQGSSEQLESMAQIPAALISASSFQNQVSILTLSLANTSASQNQQSNNTPPALNDLAPSDTGTAGVLTGNTNEQTFPRNNSSDSAQQIMPNDNGGAGAQPTSPNQQQTDTNQTFGEQASSENAVQMPDDAMGTLPEENSGSNADWPAQRDEQQDNFPQVPDSQQNNHGQDGQNFPADRTEQNQNQQQGDMQNPDNMNWNENHSNSSNSTIISLAASILVLIFGFAFALFFKRHG